MVAMPEGIYKMQQQFLRMYEKGENNYEKVGLPCLRLCL